VPGAVVATQTFGDFLGFHPHLNLWDVKRKPLPRTNAPPIDVYPIYDESAVPSEDDYMKDPEYPVEAYF